MKIMIDFLKPNPVWTYGCEHELGDWDRQVHLPRGFGVDRKDNTVMNSNGIAADPKGVMYQFGGEILTPASYTCEGQVKYLRDIKRLFPEATVNHRSNLHVHVRVPEILGNLEALKRIAEFNHRWLPKVLPIIEPIPVPTRKQYPATLAFSGAERRQRRRRRSHHTVITPGRLDRQLKAKTLDEFYAAECPQDKDGKPLWHLAPRHAVNLRHLREDTQTIEFRHFPGTLDSDELLSAVTWCKEWLQMALGHLPLRHPVDLARWYAPKLPKFPDYMHSRELRYRQTVHDGTVSKVDIEANIRSILEESDAHE